MFIRTLLPNGLRILTCPMPHVRSATIGFYVGTGSRYEPVEKAGLAHFLEHMVFKGTARYPSARQISEAIEGIGGVIDANTGSEVTTYWAKVAAQHFVSALDVLVEMLRRPLVPAPEVERERQVIIEELHMVADSPSDWVLELIGNVLWPGHPLGRDTAGTLESVANIGGEDMVSFQRGQYAPGNIVAVVAGALPQEAVEGALIAAMGDMVPLTISAYTPAPAPQPGPRVVVARREIEQANICLAVPARPYLHPDRYVQLLLDTVLGAGMSSRLFQTVREERALAYNIYSAVRQHADAGALVIYAGVSPARAPECLSAIWAEMERLAGEEVDPGELARAKEYNKGRILLRMEDSYGVASWYGGQELLLQRVEEVDAVIARIEAVQPADLHRLAQELFHRQAIHLAAVGPFADEAPLRRALGV